MAKSQNSTKNPKFYFQKQVVPCLSSAKEFSLEWHTVGFPTQTQKIELHFKTPSSLKYFQSKFMNWAEVVLGYKSLLKNK